MPPLRSAGTLADVRRAVLLGRPPERGGFCIEYVLKRAISVVS